MTKLSLAALVAALAIGAGAAHAQSAVTPVHHYYGYYNPYYGYYYYRPYYHPYYYYQERYQYCHLGVCY